jgi:hypothetical protein
MFALADPDRLRQLAEDARFDDVQIVAQETAWGPFASVDDAVTFVSEAVGPVATMLGEMTPEQRAAVEDELRTAFREFRGDVGVALPGVAWIVTGDA